MYCMAHFVLSRAYYKYSGHKIVGRVIQFGIFLKFLLPGVWISLLIFLYVTERLKEKLFALMKHLNMEKQ